MIKIIFNDTFSPRVNISQKVLRRIYWLTLYLYSIIWKQDNVSCKLLSCRYLINGLFVLCRLNDLSVTMEHSSAHWSPFAYARYLVLYFSYLQVHLTTGMWQHYHHYHHHHPHPHRSKKCVPLGVKTITTQF